MNNWELVTTEPSGIETHRLKVKGGHLYRCGDAQAATTQGVSQLLALVFVPRPAQSGIIRGGKEYAEVPDA